jgi:hypothetical protein
MNGDRVATVAGRPEYGACLLIGSVVAVAAVSYAVVDAAVGSVWGADEALVGAVLQWTLPVGVAFLLSYLWERGGDRTERQRRWIIVTSVVGSIAGYTLGALLAPSITVRPPADGSALALRGLVTGLFVALGSIGGISLPQIRTGEQRIGRRLALVAGLLSVIAGIVGVSYYGRPIESIL